MPRYARPSYTRRFSRSFRSYGRSYKPRAPVRRRRRTTSRRGRY